jgi:hypothetical protein
MFDESSKLLRPLQFRQHFDQSNLSGQSESIQPRTRQFPPSTRLNAKPIAIAGKPGESNARRNLGEGLSDRESVGEVWESEMRMIEPRILPGRIYEAIKDTWCQVNNHHHAAVFDENSIWNHEFCLDGDDCVISFKE